MSDVVSTGIFGWCNDKMHKTCIFEYESIHFTEGKGKKAGGLVKTGKIRRCNCECHDHLLDDPPVRRRRRKKADSSP